MNTYAEHWPQFYTATINNWKHLLAEDKHKDIIIDSLKFLVTEKRIELNAFVIMSNHIHLTCLPAGRYGGQCLGLHLQISSHLL